MTRPYPDMKSEFERLAEERRRILNTEHVPAEGLPFAVAPPSGVGGDIIENREGHEK